MTLLKRNILLGITGGIAAYKAADLARRLQDAGANVQAVMTTGAQEFITPLTLQALTGKPVRSDLFDAAAEAAMGHIELARWADAIVIAPASADIIAKLAHGFANDLLTTLCLATDAPIAIAPAMNRLMWASAATQANVNTLQQHGVTIIGPGDGDQACGETGAGRMLEPLEIVAAVDHLFVNRDLLAGKQVLITAGPTREALDPVRYISNRSSGKMGYAVAQAAAAAGAHVTLVSGPTNLPTPTNVQRVDVESAAQMHNAVLAHAGAADIFIATAAVADYRPVDCATQKIKKQQSEMQVSLTRNVDILAEVAKQFPQLFTVGFAAETQDVLRYAAEKRERKKLDMIAANQVGDAQAFDQNDNALTVLWANGQRELVQASKTVLGQQLIALIAEQCQHSPKAT